MLLSAATRFCSVRPTPLVASLQKPSISLTIPQRTLACRTDEYDEQERMYQRKIDEFTRSELLSTRGTLTRVNNEKLFFERNACIRGSLLFKFFQKKRLSVKDTNTLKEQLEHHRNHRLDDISCHIKIVCNKLKNCDIDNNIEKYLDILENIKFDSKTPLKTIESVAIIIDTLLNILDEIACLEQSYLEKQNIDTFKTKQINLYKKMYNNFNKLKKTKY